MISSYTSSRVQGWILFYAIFFKCTVFFIIDEEEAENDGTGAETGVNATRSSSVSEITFDKSLPRTHAVSVHCLGKIMLQYYESIESTD